MKQKDFIPSLSSIKDYSVLPDSYYIFSGKKREDKKNYSPVSDPRISDSFKNTPLRKAEHRGQLTLNAFYICANLSFDSLVPPSKEQLLQMLQISGYTSEEMENYCREIGFAPSFVPNEACAPAVLLLTRCLSDAILEQSVSRNTSERPSMQVLDGLFSYMEENGILRSFRECPDSREEAQQAYEDFARCIAEWILKQQVIQYDYDQMVKLLSGCHDEDTLRLNVLPDKPTSLRILPSLSDKSYTVRLSDAQEELLRQCQRENPDRASLFQVCADFSNLLIQKRQEAEDLRKRRVLDLPAPLVSKGFLLEFLQGDDLYQCILGEVILSNLSYCSDIPLLRDRYEDGNTDEDLVKIYDRDDILRFQGIFPISSYLARFSMHPMPSSLYCKESDIQRFRDNGCSETMARDLAVVLATGREFTRMNGNFLSSPENTSLFFPEPKTELSTLRAGSSVQEDMEKDLKDRIQKLEKEKEKAEKDRKEIERENQNLRHQAAGLRKEIKNLQRTLQDEKKEKETAVQEIFSSLSEQEAVPEESIAFPYYTSKRVVVYGGFPNFIRELSSFIPSARMISCSVHADLSPIRNADIVFMQVNSTAHSTYWAARALCKKYGVPIVYLNASSAQKCAERIVRALAEDPE